MQLQILATTGKEEYLLELGMLCLILFTITSFMSEPSTVEASPTMTLPHRPHLLLVVTPSPRRLLLLLLRQLVPGVNITTVFTLLITLLLGCWLLLLLIGCWLVLYVIELSRQSPNSQKMISTKAEKITNIHVYDDRTYSTFGTICETMSKFSRLFVQLAFCFKTCSSVLR